MSPIVELRAHGVEAQATNPRASAALLRDQPAAAQALNGGEAAVKFTKFTRFDSFPAAAPVQRAEPALARRWVADE